MGAIHFKSSRFESGYWNGLRQPAYVFDLSFEEKAVQPGALEKFDRLIAALLPTRAAPLLPSIVRQHPLLERLASAAIDILSAAGMPVMSGVNALRVQRHDGIYWQLGLSAVSADIAAPRLALTWPARLLNFLASGAGVATEGLREELQKLITACKRQSPSGVNTLLFLQAAHDEGIPWRHVANNVYQFGWGSKARWLDSSFTDETSRISTGLARDKLACATLLRDAGLPVPLHKEVASKQQALAAAESLGYPVVVKPANLDGGRGVFTGLQTPAAVQKAYAKASTLGKRILVEQHVEGNDYRLQVCKGEVLWIMHRRPAYVVGDGEATVEALIDQTNRRRAIPTADPMAEQGRNPIVIDDEVRDWLANQGLRLASVPAAGRHVRLRGAANISSGGTREAALHQAHPDNLALASLAARLMRLDLAGIDLLIPDISRSWIEGGAAICEVNAQPQISRHLHRVILPRLVINNGRIPIVVIIGTANDDKKMREKLVRQTLAEGVRLGWVDAGDSTVGGVQRQMPGMDEQASCRALLADNTVDALVWKIPHWPRSGDALPFDRVDLIAALNPAKDTADSESGGSPAGGQLRHRAARLLTPDLALPSEEKSQALESFIEQVASLIVENVQPIPAQGNDHGS